MSTLGGASAIRCAAAQDYTNDQLSLAELNALKPNVVAQLLSSAGPKAASSAQLAGTTSALESTADQLVAFGDRFSRNDFAGDQAPITAVRRLAARAEKTAADLDGALTEKVLGFATRSATSICRPFHPWVPNANSRLRQLDAADLRSSLMPTGRARNACGEGKAFA